MTGNRIALIDDEVALTQMASLILMDHGFQVETFSEPQAALACHHPGRWDLVLTDVRMPELCGFDFAQILQAKDPKLPIGLVTAYATPAMADLARQRGLRGLLAKPYEPDELIQFAQQALIVQQGFTTTLSGEC